jgi:hypothetical protein
MRCSFPALCLTLAPLAAGAAWGLSAPPSAAHPSPAPAASAAPAKPAAPASSSADNEAAAKHVKRTACLSQARAKKLVGAQRNAYVKSCVGGG